MMYMFALKAVIKCYVYSSEEVLKSKQGQLLVKVVAIENKRV